MAVTGITHDRLPCGIELEDLVTEVFDGQPPTDSGHQAACPHCQAALERLRAVHGTITALASRPVVTPPELVDEVMRRLHRDQDAILVTADARGVLTVSDRIINQIAVRAALAASEVSFASVRLVDEPRVSPLRLSVCLVVDLGPSLPEVAEAARRRIHAAVAELAGVPVGSVDVLIEDVA